MTPTVGGGLKRQKLSVSPLSESTPQAASAGKFQYGTPSASGDKLKQQQQQRVRRLTASPSVSAPVRQTERVLLYPLFGDELPPVKSAVSAAICRFLTNADLYNASLVSKLWSQVALGDTVWDHANLLRVADAGEDEDDMKGAGSWSLELQQHDV